jgi:hypothetical protein
VAVVLRWIWEFLTLSDEAHQFLIQPNKRIADAKDRDALADV